MINYIYKKELLNSVVVHKLMYTKDDWIYINLYIKKSIKKIK